MATSNGSFLHTDPPSPSPTLLPPWLSTSGNASAVRPPSPSVTLTLSPSTVPAAPPIPWLQPNTVSHGTVPSCGENVTFSELVDCCRELEEGHRAWISHKKEAAWRLSRVELQLESEKTSRRREKNEEIESKIKALREEQKAALERIEAEYREQLEGLRRDADTKEQKLAEQWAAKHMRLAKFLEQVGCRSRVAEPSSR